MPLPPLPEGRQWVVHSMTMPIFLQGKYEEDQLWLPFVDHVYFQVEHRAPKSLADLNRAHKASKDVLIKGAKRPYALNSENDRYIYLWKKDFEQRVLPFPEHQMISHKHWARLGRAEYAGWDRTATGELLEITVYADPPSRSSSPFSRRASIQQWCTDNARGCFHITPSARSIVFEREDDAMLFKLSFTV